MCTEIFSFIFEHLEYLEYSKINFSCSNQRRINALWFEIIKSDQTSSKSDTGKRKIRWKKIVQFYDHTANGGTIFLASRSVSDRTCTFHFPPRSLDLDKLHHLPEPIPNSKHFESFAKHCMGR